MKSFNHAFKEKDEYKTPSCLVEILIPYLKKWQEDFYCRYERKPVIWCPFDMPESNYVRILKAADFNIIYSHIDEGKDFFKMNIDYDIAVSNPPFSQKLKIFERFFMIKNLLLC